MHYLLLCSRVNTDLRNVKANKHRMMASKSVVHFHFKNIP